MTEKEKMLAGKPYKSFGNDNVIFAPKDITANVIAAGNPCKVIRAITGLLQTITL